MVLRLIMLDPCRSAEPLAGLARPLGAGPVGLARPPGASAIALDVITAHDSFAALTAEHCRAGRGWLGWSQGDLAFAANVSRRAVQQFEGGVVSSMATTKLMLAEALRGAGVEFLRRGIVVV